MSDYFYYTDYYAELFSGSEEKELQALVGQMFRDFELEAADGNLFRLSEMIGKHDFILLDFWASWCSPCMLTIPRLVHLYEKYSRSTFEIVGISLDDKREKWLDAIKTTKMEWPQVSDLKMWECKVAKMYGVDVIPTTILIDKSGKIVGIDLNILSIEKHIDYNKP